MLRLTPIEARDSIQDRVAKAIATELTIEGVDECGALPVAIGIMGAIQAGLDSGKMEDIIENLQNSRTWSDKWWVKYHPRSKHAKFAKIRLGRKSGLL